MRILVSGGGTAGHISPILATVDALKSLDKSAEILYVGGKGSMEAKIAAAAGLEFAGITAGKYRRYHGRPAWQRLTDLPTLALNARDIGRFGRGVAQSVRLLRSWRPDVVFIKGGYVGLPVGLAAGVLRIPYIVHESDVVPGLTNRVLSKRAEQIAVGFPANKYRGLPSEKLIYTGNPIRRNLLSAKLHQGVAHFKLDETLPTILVTGGSQGAHAVNEAVIDALPELVKRYQILHITGELEVERVRFEVKRMRMQLSHPERYHSFSFLLNDMPLALVVADVVVSRAGANTLAELAALQKPTILVPNHRLTGGHQSANAQVLARSGAVKVITEEKLTPERLIREIDSVLGDEHERKLLSDSIGKFSVIDADYRLAKLILELVPPSPINGGSDAE